MDYTGYSDNELIAQIHSGNTVACDYIISKYKNLVKARANTYFIIGADRDDIIQEGMIGLFKAIRDYDPDKQSCFYPFAQMCVTRQIVTAIKTAARKKHSPLNSYIPLGVPASEGHSSDPEHIFINKEDKHYIEEHMQDILSKLECRVLKLYLQGRPYTEISALLSKDVKSVDNAIQRVRRKVEKILIHKNLTQYDLNGNIGRCTSQ